MAHPPVLVYKASLIVEEEASKKKVTPRLTEEEKLSILEQCKKLGGQVAAVSWWNTHNPAKAVTQGAVSKWKKTAEDGKTLVNTKPGPPSLLSDDKQEREFGGQPELESADISDDETVSD